MVTNRQLLPRGFLRDYMQYILARAPTSVEWAEAQALAVLSLAMGSKRYVQTKVGPIKLNLFFMNCGPSRIAYKTTPLKYYTRPLLKEFGKQMNIDFEVPEKHTTEALIGFFSDFKKRLAEEKKRREEAEEAGEEYEPEEVIMGTINEGLMMYDELSSLFKETRNKKYLADGLEFISQLYDGHVGLRITKTHGKEGGIEVFMSMLSATTEYLFKNIDVTFFTQGTGNRFLYIMSEPKPLPISEPDEYFGLLAEGGHETNEEKMKEFAEILVDLRNKTPNTFEFTGGAARKAYDYIKKNHAYASETWKADWKNLTYSYYSERSILMLKLAALYSVSWNQEFIRSGQMLEDGASVLITERAIDWAIMRMEVYTKHFLEVLDMFPKAKAYEGQVNTMEADFNYMTAKMRELGGFATLSKIRQKTKYAPEKFKSVLHGMREIQQVFYVNLPPGPKGGRPTTIYYLQEAKDRIKRIYPDAFKKKSEDDDGEDTN